MEMWAIKITNKMQEEGISQKQLAEKIGVTQQAISKWLNGDRSPRMDVLYRICDAVGLSKEAVNFDGSLEEYYEDKKTAEIAQEIFENKDLRVLFDAARDVDPETLKKVYDMLLIMKRK